MKLLTILLVVSFSVSANTPNYWPWKGVNINHSGSYSPDNLLVLRDRLNINTVQLRLRPDTLAKNTGMSLKQAWQDSLDWLDEMFDTAKELDIGVIVSLEGFPLDKTYKQSSPLFWNNPTDLANVLDMADQISNRFSERGKELVAYQLMSEPLVVIDGVAQGPEKWPQLQIDIVRTIRANDADRWIIVTGSNAVSLWTRYTVLPFDNIVYGFHMYTPHKYTHQKIFSDKNDYSYPGYIKGVLWGKGRLEFVMSPLRKFQNDNNVLVWIGEFSAVRWAAGSGQYISDLVDIFNEYGWGWNYFSLNGWNGWNPDFGTVMNLWQKQEIGIFSKRWNVLRKITDMCNI